MRKIASHVTPACLLEFTLRLPHWTMAGSRASEYVDLPEIPHLGGLLGEQKFARVGGAWSSQGLSFSVRVTGRAHPFRYCEYDLRECDMFLVSLNARPSAAGKHAEKFRMDLCVFLGSNPTTNDPEAELSFAETASRGPLSTLGCSCYLELSKRDYSLLVSLPAKILPGFQPDVEPALKFNYAVIDNSLGVQTLIHYPAAATRTSSSDWPILELIPESH